MKALGQTLGTLDNRYLAGARVKIALLALALGVTLVATAWPREGVCLGCVWSGTCYSSSICGSNCVCVKEDSLDVGGYCAPT
jgi:hypothetical protein